MSKASRRQQRTGTASQPTTPTSTTPNSSERPPSYSATGTVRAGRRSQTRHRPGLERSFLDRYRTLIVGVVVVAAVALIGGFVFVSASAAAYTCTTIWSPEPTASPAAGATNPPGYVQPDMGRRHAEYGTNVTYQYCAPASGSHYSKAGSGPIQPRLYGPSDTVIPQGWIHNLEHGAIVILYTGTSDGASPDGQRQLQAFYDAFPDSPICGLPKGAAQEGPVIARFDQMATDYSAIVWGRVLPLETFDEQAILDFYAAWGDRTNPEPKCEPAPSASPGASPAATPSLPPSASPSLEPSVSPS